MKRMLIITALCILLVVAGSTAAVSAARGGAPGTPDSGKSPIREYPIRFSLPLPHDSTTAGTITINTDTGHYVANFHLDSRGLIFTYGSREQVIGHDTKHPVRIPVGEPQVVGTPGHRPPLEELSKPINLHWEGALTVQDAYWIAGHSDTMYFALEPVQ